MGTRLYDEEGEALGQINADGELERDEGGSPIPVEQLARGAEAVERPDVAEQLRQINHQAEGELEIDLGRITRSMRRDFQEFRERMEGDPFALLPGEIWRDILDYIPRGKGALQALRQTHSRFNHSEVTGAFTDTLTGIREGDEPNDVERLLEYVDPGERYEIGLLDNKLHGPYRIWNVETGQLTMEGHFEDGKRNGVMKLWDPDNGVLFEKSYFKNDLRQGVRKRWDVWTGRLISEGHYKDGKKDGVWKEWDRNTGILVEEGHYKDDDYDGVFKLWDRETGILDYELHYKDGEQHGVFRRWDSETGELLAEGYIV